MPDFSREPRLLSGAVTPPTPVGPGRSETVSIGQVLTVLRRRYRLVLLTTALGAAGGAYLASREPPTYLASAVLRMAGERRAMTGNMEGPSPEFGRTTDPIASMVQLVLSRSVMGAVVDTLGLQVRPLTPEFPATLLSGIEIDPRAAGDSVMLEFAPEQVTGRYGGREATARYGEPLALGPVRLAVTARPEVPSAVLNIVPREVAVDWLRLNMSVEDRPNTDLIDVKFPSDNPRLAQQIVNWTVQSFQSLNIQAAKEKSKRRREFLQEQVVRTDSMLGRAQAELAAFRSRQQVASSEAKLGEQQAAIMALEARRSELEADRSTFGSLQKQLRAGKDEDRAEALRALASSPAIGDNPKVAGLYQQLNNYQYRLDSMTTGPWAAAPTNPDVIQLRSLITTAQGQLAQQVGSHVTTLDARISALSSLRDRSGKAIQVLPAMVEEEMRLTTRVQALNGSAEDLRQEFQKATMAEAVEAGDVDIVDLSDVPYAAVWTTASIKFGLGLLLGVLLGGGLAFLMEALNTSIRRPEDLEAALHIPGLAVIPRLTPTALGRPRLGGLIKGAKGPDHARSRAAAIGTVAQPFSIGTEAFRMLRTSLIWSDGAEQLKTLVVTSAAPGEGKTLTAANLAASFAHDGLRVLLVDCDVRRPKLHGLFRAPRSPGLLDLLAPPTGGNSNPFVRSLSFNAEAADGNDPLEHVLRPTPIRGLTLLTCGALPTNASNLLSGVRMRSLLQELTKRFELVILDTPPVLATADAGILGSLADGVLLVVRAGQTDRAAAQRAYHQLENVGSRVVGAVLNDPKGEVSQYGDYYYPYEYAAEKE